MYASSSLLFPMSNIICWSDSYYHLEPNLHVYSSAKQRCKAIMIPVVGGGEGSGKWVNAIFAVICFPYKLCFTLLPSPKGYGSSSLHL